MSSTTELEELRRLIGKMRQCVTALTSTYGYASATRRIANDAEQIGTALDRLEIDLHDLGPVCAVIEPRRPHEMIQIPESQYDINFWRDVDHEGIGGQNGACVRVARTRKAR